MKKIYLIVIITLFCLNNTTVLAQKTQLTTKWQSEKYKNIEAISNMDFLYDSDNDLLYLLTNDEENLYVHLRTINELPEKKLIDFGFSIEIKLKGDKTKRIVEYPLPQNERMTPVILIQNNSEERRNNFNLVKEQVIKQIYNIRLTGFSDEITRVKAAGNDFNITGSLKLNNLGQLQYLVTIPIKSIGIKLADDVLMNITLKSGSMEAPINQNPDANVDDVGNADQRGANNPTMGNQNRGQGMQPGNMGQQQMGSQQMGMNNQMRERSPERDALSEAIVVKLRNLMLLKVEN